MAEPYTYRISKGSIFLGVLMLVSSLGAFLFFIIESAASSDDSLPFAAIIFLFAFFLALRFVLRTTVSIRIGDNGITQTTCLRKRMVRWEDVLTMYVRVPVDKRLRRWDVFFKHRSGCFSIGDWTVGGRNRSLVQAVETCWKRPNIVEHLYPRDVIETPRVRYKGPRRLLMLAGLLSYVVLAALKIVGLLPSVTWMLVAIEPTVAGLYFLFLVLVAQEVACMEIRRRSAKSAHWPETLARRLRVPFYQEGNANLLSLCRAFVAAPAVYYVLVIALRLMYPYPDFGGMSWIAVFLWVPLFLCSFLMSIFCLAVYYDAWAFRRQHTRKGTGGADRHT